MLDVNYPCQKSYLIALTGISYNSVAVPVYYQEIPDNVSPDNYIIYDGIVNTDASTFHSADTFTSMRVSIHTFQMKYNTGRAAAFIGGEVFSRIYPTKQAIIDLSPDGLQCVSTELTQDITQQLFHQTSKVYIDRILIFRHRIYHGQTFP